MKLLSQQPLRGTKRFFNLRWSTIGRPTSVKIRINQFDGSFHQAIAPVLCLGQCIALMPVVNICSRNFRNVRFKLCSFRLWYCLGYLTMGGIYSVLTCRWSIKKGLNITNLSDVVYILVVYLTAIFFMHVAFKWPKVLREFGNCEKLLLQEHYNHVVNRYMGWNLSWKIRSIAAGILGLAVIEDSLSYFSAYQSNEIQIAFCNRTNVTFWENFYLREHPQVFSNIPINFGTILLVEWVNKSMRYAWTYLDIFIISFSMAVQFRYDQIYHRLAALEGRSYPATFWRDTRLDYVAVSRLVAFIDDTFGHLILLACANDMFFIATQLFNGFQQRPAFATTIYFWYSLSLLIFRTICMLYVGSGVQVASMSPLNILRNVPSKIWGLDLQRLVDDVASGENVLSGKKFFYLKRQIILAMAGTLVTYELVLMDQVKQAPDLTKDCSIFWITN
ncbi:gustatory receptor for sugar taste 64b-like [Uranotaenia lowii]|uniref:gustatory receptor for sugar taste 64b-like n=1 Tax=Uranotaenia lowii TaxID=190385 RepID=UPI002479C640|nr:gustatory receptor for sugar taste 64b-like [Uranotaenia lowii]